MRFLTTFSSRVLNAHVLVMKHDELCRETWMIDEWCDDTDRVNKFPEWRHDGETIPRNENDVVESGKVNVIQKMMANERESTKRVNLYWMGWNQSWEEYSRF